MEWTGLVMKMNRRRFLQTGTALLPLLSGWRLRAGAAARELKLDASGNVFLAPDDPEQWPAFRAALAQWRTETKARLHYSDASLPPEGICVGGVELLVLLPDGVRRDVLGSACWAV